MAVGFQGCSNLGSTTGTTLTASYTVNAASNYLLVGVIGDSNPPDNDDVTGVTYNGVSMTFVGKAVTGVYWLTYLFELALPTPGTHNVVVSASSPHNLAAIAADYSGATRDNLGIMQNVWGMPTVLSSVANNCWGIMMMGGFQSLPGGVTQNQFNCVVRATSAAFHDYALFDTNGAQTPAGPILMEGIIGLSANTQYLTSIMATIAPSGTIANQGAADLGNNSGGSNSLTASYTVNASSNKLIVVFLGDSVGGNDDVTSVTYNGTSMTLVAKTTSGQASNNRYSYMYYLDSPSTGAHNVVITCTNTHYILASAADYSGTASGIDAHTTYNSIYYNTTGGITLAPVASNCWGVTFGGLHPNGVTLTATSGTIRAQGSSHNYCLVDTAGTVTAGVPAWLGFASTDNTANYNDGVSNIMVTLKPGGPAPGGGGSNLIFGPFGGLNPVGAGGVAALGWIIRRREIMRQGRGEL